MATVEEKWADLTLEEQKFWNDIQESIDNTGGKARVIAHINKEGKLEMRIIILKPIKGNKRTKKGLL